MRGRYGELIKPILKCKEIDVLVEVYIAVVAGAHLNPAVSVALACVGKLPFSSVLHYVPAQYLGAWLGSALVLLTYR